NIRGKIVFFNRPMDPTLINTFQAYSNAVDQRGSGAAEAAKYGAIGVIVRSMTLAHDDNPHTGAMHYNEEVEKIPAAAISKNGAGCVQSMEIIRLFKKLHLKPKRTIRVVLFMNEEFGLRGGKKYFEEAQKDSVNKYIAALESDRGGFSPKGFEVDTSQETVSKM